MTQSILITRPQEQAEKTASLFINAGFQTYVDPILEVNFYLLPSEHLLRIPCWVITSQNALHSICAQTSFRPEHLFCLSAYTRQEAEEHNFKNIHISPEPNAKSLCDDLKNKTHLGPFLFLRAQDIAYDLCAHLPYLKEHIIYETLPRTLSLETKELICQNHITAVLLCSVKSAQFFMKEVPCSLHHLTLLALSEKIAVHAHQELWKNTIIGSTIPALLAKFKEN